MSNLEKLLGGAEVARFQKQLLKKDVWNDENLFRYFLAFLNLEVVS